MHYCYDNFGLGIKVRTGTQENEILLSIKVPNSLLMGSLQPLIDQNYEMELGVISCGLHYDLFCSYSCQR